MACSMNDAEKADTLRKGAIIDALLKGDVAAFMAAVVIYLTPDLGPVKWPSQSGQSDQRPSS